MAGRDRGELCSCLITLYEHLLKREFVNMPECFRGWESTILGSKIELKALLKQSPSLGSYFDNVAEEYYRDTLEIVRSEYSDYFPDERPFTLNSQLLLEE